MADTNYDFGGGVTGSVAKDSEGHVKLDFDMKANEPPELSDQKDPDSESQECSGPNCPNNPLNQLDDALKDADQKLKDMAKDVADNAKKLGDQIKSNVWTGLVNADNTVGAVFSGSKDVGAALDRLGKTLMTRAVDNVYQGGSQQAMQDFRSNVGPVAKGAQTAANNLANGLKGLTGKDDTLQDISGASDKVAAPFALVGSKIIYMTPGGKQMEQFHAVAQAGKIAKVAKATDQVILVQHVNPKAAGLMQKGAATKPMNIKGKTDLNGNIPMDQKLSPKGAAKGDSWAEKQNKSLQGKVDSGEYTTMKGPNGNDVLAKQLPNGKIVPVTADYDLLAIGSKGPLESPINHPTLGTVTPSQQATINKINQSINHSGGNVVHHGPENLFKGEGAKFPVTAATPKGVKVIHNEAQLKNFFNQQNAKGYNLQPHESWGWSQGPNGQWQ